MRLFYTHTTSFVFSALCCDDEEDYNLERERKKRCFFLKRQKGEIVFQKNKLLGLGLFFDKNMKDFLMGENYFLQLFLFNALHLRSVHFAMMYLLHVSFLYPL